MVAAVIISCLPATGPDVPISVSTPGGTNRPVSQRQLVKFRISKSMLGGHWPREENEQAQKNKKTVKAFSIKIFSRYRTAVYSFAIINVGDEL